MKEYKKCIKKLSAIHLMYGLAMIIIIATLVLLGWFLTNRTSSDGGFNFVDNKEVEEEHEEDCAFRRVLDGMCVETAKGQHVPIVAVMIENHFEARPQAGLSQASIVYEAPVEGNIPRFLALYPMMSSTILEMSNVGPVRSARSYYLDWLHEYDNAMYMHVGGSPESLARIKRENINDFNQFWQGNHFWRSTQKYAPHNVYTSAELWTNAWETFFADDEIDVTQERWQFEEWDECEDECVDSIYVQFSGDTYAAEWRYSISTHEYHRYQLGSLHTDEDGTVITADTIIIQDVVTRVIDNVGRLRMDTIGTGDAYVFSKGNVIGGTWQKDSVEDVTIFFDGEGNEIALQSGKIWIEVMGSNTLYTFK